MKNNYILIISNDEEIGKSLSEKIKLLRECDTIKIVSYIEAISALNSTQPAIILLYCGHTDNTGIVKEIRTIKSLDKVPIIFITESFTEDKLLFAFDNGVDDFFFTTDPDSIILMRIFLTLQKSVLYKQIEINNDILISSGILDKNSGIYLKEYVPIVMKNFFSKSIEENLENTIFMYVKPMPVNNKRLNLTKLAQAIKSVLRGNDIVGYGKSSGFYLLLYSAGVKGAQSVLKRIQNIMKDECKIFANAAEVTTSFEEIEPVLYQNMKYQIQEDNDFNFFDELANGEIPENVVIKDETGKKFKDFKKEFYTGFEKITAPVFYQIQSTYSEKFPEAEIKFNMTETESTFSIEQGNLKSELSIKYPAYIKLIIDIKHFDDTQKPVIRRLTYDFEDYSEEKLSSLLKDMINEFSQRISLNSIYSAE